MAGKRGERYDEAFKREAIELVVEKEVPYTKRIMRLRRQRMKKCANCLLLCLFVMLGCASTNVCDDLAARCDFLLPASVEDVYTRIVHNATVVDIIISDPNPMAASEVSFVVDNGVRVKLTFDSVPHVGGKRADWEAIRKRTVHIINIEKATKRKVDCYHDVYSPSHLELNPSLRN